ncbi:regulatory protein GemA [Nitrospirillum amazonense]|uniref:regulatory protein GemA n=1 Tax=Nitrospirillum amazonense TaxID=28077 RepID=UPI0024128CAD|nr:regulatory protein GemA [Nitrospirillum amazonense]MDG3442425.1 regulatory protein GemA [Nitrospirillum amazonense]
MTTAAAIKAIQACRRQVAGLDDDATWRDFLHATVGLRSLRQMTGPQLGRVIDALHAQGAPKRAPRSAGRPVVADDPQSVKIRAMWRELHRISQVKSVTEATIAGWASRQLGKPVADLRFLTGDEKRRLIEALKQWHQRVGLANA